MQILSPNSQRSGAASAPSLTVRWMIRRELAQVMRIERESFEFNWSEQDFVDCLKNRACIGMVAERDEQILGYLIYELRPKEIVVLNVAVAPEARRTGVGRAMLAKLKEKIDRRLEEGLAPRRTRIILDVRECSTETHLWLRECGFRAVKVLRDHYKDTDEAAYRFRYQVPVPDASQSSREATGEAA